MALVLKDRVQETTTTTGTGTITLGGAVAGFSSFSTIGNGNTTMYCIYDGTSLWEAGIGTYTLSGTTLARTTVLANSSGTTSLISFNSGTKFVICGLPAEYAVLSTPITSNYIPYGSGTNTLNSSSSFTYNNSTGDQTAPQQVASNGLVLNSATVSTSYTIATGNNAMSAGPVTISSGVTVTISSGQRWVII